MKCDHVNCDEQAVASVAWRRHMMPAPAFWHRCALHLDSAKTELGDAISSITPIGSGLDAWKGTCIEITPTGRDALAGEVRR